MSEANSSPTVAWLRDQLIQKYPGLQWHEYEPLSWDNERAGTKLAFGTPMRPMARLDKAQIIVTLDCDLFVEHPAGLRYSRDFARSRRPDVSSLGAGKMNRLYSIESTFTNTGAMADHRLPLRSEHVLPFVMALYAKVGGGAGGIVAPGAEFLKEEKIAKFLTELAADLASQAGRVVVLAGRRQSPEVHALVALINDALHAVGATLDYIADPAPDRASHLSSITKLVKDIGSNQVQTLIILGGNPVFDAPVDLDFAGALKKVKRSLHLAEYQNETSLKANWHIPRAHFLEAWGDVRTWDGTIAIAQPLIAPMYGGVSPIELLSWLHGEDQPGDAIVRSAFAALGITADWRQSVHDGFVPGTAYPIATVTASQLGSPQLTPSQLAGSRARNGEIEVVFHYSSTTYDGRFANNVAARDAGLHDQGDVGQLRARQPGDRDDARAAERHDDHRQDR